MMGSMTVPLPLPYLELMLNDWEVIGNFMYPRQAYRRLLDMARSGHLNLGVIHPRTLPLSDLPEAMELAATAGNHECIVKRHEGYAMAIRSRQTLVPSRPTA